MRTSLKIQLANLTRARKAIDADTEARNAYVSAMSNAFLIGMIVGIVIGIVAMTFWLTRIVDEVEAERRTILQPVTKERKLTV